MASTNYINGTVVQPEWLNDVNNFVYGNSIFAPIQGVPTDGVSDCSASIQTVINNNPGRTIYFPGGVYCLSSAISVTSPSTRIIGSGKNATFFKTTTINIDAWQFTCTDQSTKTSFLSNVGFTNAAIFSSVANSTTGAGLRLLQVNGGDFFDFSISNMPEGLSISGGQLTNIYSFRVFASGTLWDNAGIANSALIHVGEAPITGGLWQIPFSTQISIFELSASKALETCIHISAGDGIQFSNYYMAGGFLCLVKPKMLREGVYIGSTSFSDGYTDCVSTNTGTSYICDIQEDGFTTSYIYGLTFANNQGGNGVTGILSRKLLLKQLKLQGNTWNNFTNWVMDLEATSNLTDVQILGNDVDNFNTAGSAGAYRVKNVNILNVTGGSATNTGNASGAALNTSGTINTMSVGDWALSNTNADWANSATYLNNPTSAGVVSDNAGSLSRLCGLRAGNKTSNDPASQDWYLESTTGTPFASFSGSSTGITYTTQSLNTTRIGNRVLGELLIQFSNIGSFSGSSTFLLGGLPYTSITGIASPVSIRITSISSAVTVIQGEIVPGTTTIRLDKLVSGSLTQLTFADLLNTTNVQLSFNYVTND